jgi:hypothetical protein
MVFLVLVSLGFIAAVLALRSKLSKTLKVVIILGVVAAILVFIYVTMQINATSN